MRSSVASRSRPSPNERRLGIHFTMPGDREGTERASHPLGIDSGVLLALGLSLNSRSVNVPVPVPEKAEVRASHCDEGVLHG